MPDGLPSETIRAAEVVGALSLATDLGMGLPLEHSLNSTVAAMRLAAHLGLDRESTSQTFYGALLSYIGCTADAEIAANLFEEGALLTHFTPVMFGSPRQAAAGIVRALAGSGGPGPVRLGRALLRLPGAARGHRGHRAAICEVGTMLTRRLGLPRAVTEIFAHLTERWDGKGDPGTLSGEDLPLALRIVHVASDATFQRMIGGYPYAARVIGERAGHALDPSIAKLVVDNAEDVLVFRDDSACDQVFRLEPEPHIHLTGDSIEDALAAMGDFTDLISPFLVGHSSTVAHLAIEAARRCRLSEADAVAVHRAAFVHDIGRVAISAHVWQKAGPLTADEWERVRPGQCSSSLGTDAIPGRGAGQ